jgi:hypothetical protein
MLFISKAFIKNKPVVFTEQIKIYTNPGIVFMLR